MSDRILLDGRVRRALMDIARCHDDPAITARIRSLASQALQDPASLRRADARELAEIIAGRSVVPLKYR